MTNTYRKLKKEIKKIYDNKFAVEIGYYSQDDKLQKEEVVPLGNYIYDPLPSESEQIMTKLLSNRISRA
tara:strand:+ start:141 stop:347 length:207 start_codon:yes stop_codon:yes gene_type:complete